MHMQKKIVATATESEKIKRPHLLHFLLFSVEIFFARGRKNTFIVIISRNYTGFVFYSTVS